MNQFPSRNLSGLAACAAAAVLAGCASVAVTNDALQQRTAVGLSLVPGSFTITNRQNSGVQTNYNVTTQDGPQFACYVTGGVSITGRNVSDAICRPAAGATGAAATPTTKPAATCNALLQAAGRC
jgi:hypothetical protein